MIDLILHNANIHTVDVKQPVAEAVAIGCGMIVAIGRNDDVLPLAQRDTEIVNLNGKSVTPGLVDAHVHFERLANTFIQTDLFKASLLTEAIQQVGEAATGKNSDEWVLGWGWDNEAWLDPSLPTAADLDRVVPHCPVFLDHRAFLHGAWVNSRALEIAGIDAQTPDPDGGKIQRDEGGNPTGVLFEQAVALVSKHIPPPSTAKLAEAMLQAQTHCWQKGLVGLHDFDGEACFKALQWIHQQGDLGMRVVKNIPVYLLEHVIAVGLHSGFGDDFLRVGGIKIFADGTLSTRLALMVAPYEGEPDNYGIATTDKALMKEQSSLASQHLLSLTIHAIGDQALHDVLDVLELVRQEEAQRGVSPRQLRHRIEHVQVYDPPDRERLAQLNVTALMNPIHVIFDMETVDQLWGERGRYTHAYRDMVATGAVVAFGSDAPFASIDPWQGIMAAVMRRWPNSPPDTAWYPEQQLTLAEAIHGFTLAAAIATNQEQRHGSVSVGKLADLTIFDRDIFALAPNSYPEVTVAGTIVNGEFKYRAFD
ncbi:MAG: amidohydrolase [Chloroflexi bacterium]|nr:amidohydrolase [Chloroflexota bacterium]